MNASHESNDYRSLGQLPGVAAAVPQTHVGVGLWLVRQLAIFTLLAAWLPATAAQQTTPASAPNNKQHLTPATHSQSNSQPASLQRQNSPGTSSNSNSSDSSQSPLTIPAGTSIELVLTHTIDTRLLRRGDDIHAQITDPVMAGGQAVVPPGSFLQGKIKSFARKGSRARILLQSASLVFPDGTVVAIPGPLRIESDEFTAEARPSDPAGFLGTTAPMIGGGLGVLIGSRFKTTETLTPPPLPPSPVSPPSLPPLTDTHTSMKALTIGSLVGLGAGLATMAVIATRTRHFYIEEGAPMEMRLPAAVTIGASPEGSAGD